MALPGAESQKPTLTLLGGVLQTEVVPILFIRVQCKKKVTLLDGRWEF